MKTKLALTAALLAFCAQAVAEVEIQTQPTEVIRATPLTPFTDRVGTWPTHESSNEIMQTETEQVERYLNTIPGIQARGGSGSPAISIRGSAQAARTLSLFDGVPLFLSDGFGAPKLLLPQEVLDEVRLLKGPASVFYGPAAMAGALNYIPRIFEDPAVRIGLNDQGNGVANRNLLGVVPFVRNEDGLLQASVYSEFDPGDFDFQSVTQATSGRRINNSSRIHRFTLLGSHSVHGWKVNERLIGALGEGTLPGSISGGSPIIYDSKNLLASIDASGALSTDLSFALGVSHLRDDDTFTAAEDSKTVTTRELVTTDFTQTLQNGWVVRTFLDASHDKLNSQGFSKDRALTENIELGQVWEVPLGDGVTFQPGARWIEEYDKFIPAIAFTMSQETSRAWLTYAEGFRRPSLFDLYSSDATYQANPDLKPEVARQIEFGYLQQPVNHVRSFNRGVTWSVALYGINYDEFFEYVALSPTLSTKENRGDAIAYGGEASLLVAMGSRSFSLGYNHLQGELKATDEPLTLSPRHQVSAAVSQGIGPVIFEVRDTYTSAFFDREFSGSQRKLPDANIIDLNLRSIGFTNWEFKGGILNVFDEPRELTIGYPEPQRTYYFSALRYL